MVLEVSRIEPCHNSQDSRIATRKVESLFAEDESLKAESAESIQK